MPAPKGADLLPPLSGPGIKRALVICGHPGDDAHRKLFAESVEKLQKGLADRWGFAPEEIRIQFGGKVAEGEGPVLARVRGQATREEIASDADELRRTLRPDDTLWVIVMGHAHYDGTHSWLNLPGPDIHERDFAKLFADLPAREQVFFIMTPASGFHIKSLSEKGRVVITATEADLEVNETVCPHSLAEVISTPPAAADFDVDRDGSITLFDLYIVLARNVSQRYASDMDLPTEHAQLDDNGDGRGSELQIDYLPEDQGGRAGKQPPPIIKMNADGWISKQKPVSVVFPEPEAKTN